MADLSNAIGSLEEDGHVNSKNYFAILRSAWAAKLRALVSNTATKIIETIKDLFPAGIYVSDSLYASNAATTSAIVGEGGQDNFELIIERDLTVFAKQDEDMNLHCKVYEVLAPRIKRPAAICELTGLS